MKYNDFICLKCFQQTLQAEAEQLICQSCQTTYLMFNSVPLLFPSGELAAQIEGKNHTLEEIQAVYDKVYKHDGLMGTDLDLTYDQSTKEILLSFGGNLAQKKLLDVGTGVGRLWDYVPKDVQGYAIEPSIVGAVKSLQRRPDLIVSASVGEHIPYPDSYFDMVISADTIEHTFSPQQTLSEIQRVLKAGGTFSASFPIPDSLRKWGRNQLVRRRFNLSFLYHLTKVVLKRYLLFGKAAFQPIDRDLDVESWKQLIRTSGFSIQQVIEWPQTNEIPIVVLIHAVKDIP